MVADEADPARRRVWLPALAATAVVAMVLIAALALRPSSGSSQIPPGLLGPPTPSDPRAQFVDGNVTTCAGVGLASDIQVGAGGSSASDANVSGTVKSNAGVVQPGKGQEVDVAILGAGVVIDAVIVKGGPAYNVYSNARFLPPSLLPDQHYISPLNGGGNVPDISHWFICYHLTTPPPLGSLTVAKVVIPPPGPPVSPLPTEFTALVNCNDGVHQNVVITFGAGGGRQAGSTISGIADGTVCTVVEQNTSSFPPGSAATYKPTGANTTGVTIAANTSVQVTITNDFTGVERQTGTLALVKTVLPAPPDVNLPASYTAHVLCDDGTTVDVSLPGAGGPGVPVVTAPTGTLCALIEDTSSLPPGWVVTYTVGNGSASATPPLVVIVGNTTITVTITNDASAVTTTTTTTPTTTTTAPTTTTTAPTTTTTATTLPAETTTTAGSATTTGPTTSSAVGPATTSAVAPGSTSAGQIPPTGSDPLSPGAVALVAVAVGAGLVLLTRRRVA